MLNDKKVSGGVSGDGAVAASTPLVQEKSIFELKIVKEGFPFLSFLLLFSFFFVFYLPLLASCFFFLSSMTSLLLLDCERTQEKGNPLKKMKY